MQNSERPDSSEQKNVMSIAALKACDARKDSSNQNLSLRVSKRRTEEATLVART
jgi:hypothetical protein